MCQFLINLIITFPHEPAVVSLAVYPTDMKTCVCTKKKKKKKKKNPKAARVFLAALCSAVQL